MQFQPSSHSYGDAATAAANPSAPSGDSTAEAARIAADLFGRGIDAWRAKSEADPDLARYKAAARKKGKKKRGGKKPASFPSADAASAAPTTAVVPAEQSAGMSPWLKWGLIAGGGALVLFIAWKAFSSKKHEDHDDRPHRRNPKTRQVTRTIKEVRPAPRSSASMFRDLPTEEVIEEVVEQTHGDAYEDSPGEFDYGDGGEE